MPSTRMIQENLRFTDTGDLLLIAYHLSNVKEDAWQDIFVLLNGDTAEKTIQLPDGNWMLCGDGNSINEKGIRKLTGIIKVPSTTAYILYRLK